MKRTTKYTIGTQIPAKEILRRFKDEDGEIFVEIRGMNDVLFRVTEGDQVYYKIEKSKMKGEELTLVVDYTIVRPKTVSFPNVHNAKHQMIREDDGTETDALWGPISAAHKKEIIPDDKTVFDEGDKIPKRLRDKCKKNEYGGYTLRYNNFLYMMDRKYRVEIKTPDSNHKYELEENALSPPLESTKDDSNGDDILTLTDPLTESDTDMDLDMDMRMETDIELEPGDILPARLKSLCEAEIGHSFGSHIVLGNYLYQLDPSFKVLKKMRISYMDDTGNKGPEPTAAEPEESAVPRKELSVEEIVNRMVNTFETGLDTYNIHADYFKETALRPDNRDILIRAYHGDLEGLNDDTREAASLGKIVKLPKSESGFNLFKAAFIHELYIKSTVSGRGENMKYFITLIAATQPDGTAEELQDNLSLEEQKEMVKFFKDRAHVYTDKTDTITRVYLQVRGSIFEQYEKLLSAKEKVRFNALLIGKLYELTTRLDRGNGITMIRLTRDLLDWPFNEY
ncbi:MAG: hypothetical protein PVH61_02875 [Candidatus Aminicenantes bacterium]|jgi:hypothetical protein